MRHSWGKSSCLPVSLRKVGQMTEGRHFKNIALVGFMGTGKSTVGQLVAGMLRFRFVDTDEMIEGIAGRKIADIFTTQGEARFREYEQQVVKQLEGYSSAVISTGGGLLTNPGNLASLKTHSLVVCLWCSPETIYKRVGHQSHRPLLRVENPLERIRALLQDRAPAYRQADVLLNSEFRKAREVAMHVVHQFRSVTGADREGREE
jgi:shikimate kinase